MEKKQKKLDWLPYGMLPLPITLKCWESEEYKNELLKDPKKLLENEGYELDKNLKIIIHSNKNSELHFSLPEIPHELAEKENWKDIWDSGCTKQTTCAATGTCDIV